MAIVVIRAQGSFEKELQSFFKNSVTIINSCDLKICTRVTTRCTTREYSAGNAQPGNR